MLPLTRLYARPYCRYPGPRNFRRIVVDISVLFLLSSSAVLISNLIHTINPFA